MTGPFLPLQGGNIELLTQQYWPTVHPSLQERRAMEEDLYTVKTVEDGREDETPDLGLTEAIQLVQHRFTTSEGRVTAASIERQEAPIEET
jgi:hypothetical protein